METLKQVLPGLVECTEDEMLEHLAKFKARGVPDPDYRKTHFFGPQWKAIGAWNYWQKGNGPIEAMYGRGVWSRRA